MSIRPNHRTIHRPSLTTPPVAFAAAGGTCDHVHDAEPDDLIVLLGSEVVRKPDGTSTVDLSGASWHPLERCAEVAA